jgi:lipoate-protein ligase A
MENDAVALSRRRSGGGAVYQDLGNSCFSFLTPVPGEKYPLDFAKAINNKILLATLSDLGISAELSGRNDILHGGRKISGSAYKVKLGSFK